MIKLEQRHSEWSEWDERHGQSSREVAASESETNEVNLTVGAWVTQIT